MKSHSRIGGWNAGIRTGLGALLSVFLLLAGCGPPEPIRIGFVGGVSGRVADLGIAGRNGAQLAVELRNQAGGVAGRPVELLVRDDQQDPEVAEQVTRELIARGVVAIVGPMTSAMAMRMTPIADEARVLLISPTVTTRDLSGRDDYFFRVNDSTGESAFVSARYQLHVQGLRRVAVAYDLNNRSYTESWLHDFREAFAQGGGEVIEALGFESGHETALLPIARALLADAVDGVVLVANSVDTALLCQQIRKLDANVSIVVSEWGATERLVELGGQAVEGVTVTQSFDRNSAAPRYQAFRQAYLGRFGQEPGFAGTAAFDATQVVLEALARRRSGQSLKQAVLAARPFEGLQSPLNFDDFGDARRKNFITVVREGRFVVVE